MHGCLLHDAVERYLLLQRRRRWRLLVKVRVGARIESCDLPARKKDVMLRRNLRNVLFGVVTLLNLTVTRSLYACTCTTKGGSACSGDCCTPQPDGSCVCVNKGIGGCS